RPKWLITIVRNQRSRSAEIPDHDRRNTQSWDSDAVVIEPRHRLAQRLRTAAGKPAIRAIHAATQPRKANAQIKGEALVLRCQPAPPRTV
ncbi:hypothetical protein ACFFG5_17810, partial [Paraburkholderia humisilvae]